MEIKVTVPALIMVRTRVEGRNALQQADSRTLHPYELIFAIADYPTQHPTKRSIFDSVT